MKVGEDMEGSEATVRKVEETPSGGTVLELESGESDEEDVPSAYCFLVDERAYCMWDWDIEMHNRSYLQTINPRYFEYIADNYSRHFEDAATGDSLDDESSGQKVRDELVAAATLRTTYSHATETLLALICAAVQAPRCPLGWMLKYNNEDLRRVVRKIHDAEPLKTLLTLDKVTWETLSSALLTLSTGDAETDARIRMKFGKLWRRLANEFLDPLVEKEYTSFKHGLRLSMHGFTLIMGLQSEPNVPPPPEHMHLVAHNRFGSSFYVAEPLQNGSTKADAIPFVVRRHLVNWHPLKYVKLLWLISMSIENVINTLKVVNGIEPSEAGIIAPADEALFDEAWSFHQHEANMSHATLDPKLAADGLPTITRDDVVNLYQTANQAVHR